MSSATPSCLMNPYPFWSLNHFTVPVGMQTSPNVGLYTDARPHGRATDHIFCRPSLRAGRGNKGEILKACLGMVKKNIWGSPICLKLLLHHDDRAHREAPLLDRQAEIGAARLSVPEG